MIPPVHLLVRRLNKNDKRTPEQKERDSQEYDKFVFWFLMGLVAIQIIVVGTMILIARLG